MVFESRTGDTIILGATTWRIEEITHDRVTVTPAPGEPGKMPFWHGDSAGRPAEFGREIGEMTRELLATAARRRLHATGRRAQPRRQRRRESAALSRRPDRRHRPRAQRSRHRHRALPRRTGRLARLRAHPVRQPRARAVVHGGHREAARRARHRSRDHVDRRRLRDPPAGNRGAAGDRLAAALARGVERPGPAAAGQHLALRREIPRSRRARAAAAEAPRRNARAALAAAQARRRPAGRGVALFDVPDPARRRTASACAKFSTCRPRAGDSAARSQRGTIRVTAVDSDKPSPYASRAAVLLHRELHLRWRRAAGRTPRPGALHRSVAARRDSRQHGFSRTARQGRARRSRSATAIARPGLSGAARRRRARSAAASSAISRLEEIAARSASRRRSISRRAAPPRAAPSACALPGRRASSPWNTPRAIAMRWACRCRRDSPEVFLEPADRSAGRILRRYARTHGPFTTAECRGTVRLCQPSQVEPVLRRLHADGKLLEGEFRPTGVHREWCDPDVLQQIRRKTLARLRREVVPAEQHTFARLLDALAGRRRCRAADSTRCSTPSRFCKARR